MNYILTKYGLYIKDLRKYRIHRKKWWIMDLNLFSWFFQNGMKNLLIY